MKTQTTNQTRETCISLATCCARFADVTPVAKTKAVALDREFYMDHKLREKEHEWNAIFKIEHSNRRFKSFERCTADIIDKAISTSRSVLTNLEIILKIDTWHLNLLTPLIGMYGSCSLFRTSFDRKWHQEATRIK